MEITGSTCTICGQHIVLAREGMCCPTCRIVVHRACDAQSTCSRCGEKHEIPEPPVADVLRDAIVPRSLRPTHSASAVASVIGAALAFLIGFALLLLLLQRGGGY